MAGGAEKVELTPILNGKKERVDLSKLLGDNSEDEIVSFQHSFETREASFKGFQKLADHLVLEENFKLTDNYLKAIINIYNRMHTITTWPDNECYETPTERFFNKTILPFCQKYKESNISDQQIKNTLIEFYNQTKNEDFSTADDSFDDSRKAKIYSSGAIDDPKMEKLIKEFQKDDVEYTDKLVQIKNTPEEAKFIEKTLLLLLNQNTYVYRELIEKYSERHLELKLDLYQKAFDNNTQLSESEAEIFNLLIFISYDYMSRRQDFSPKHIEKTNLLYDEIIAFKNRQTLQLNSDNWQENIKKFIQDHDVFDNTPIGVKFCKILKALDYPLYKKNPVKYVNQISFIDEWNNNRMLMFKNDTLFCKDDIETKEIIIKKIKEFCQNLSSNSIDSFLNTSIAEFLEQNGISFSTTDSSVNLKEISQINLDILLSSETFKKGVVMAQFK